MARGVNGAYRDAWTEPEHQLEEWWTIAGGASVYVLFQREEEWWEASRWRGEMAGVVGV